MATITSPLRYPGSKRRLAKYIDKMIHANDLKPDLFVEVFAGGASLSLQLLESETVQQVGLIEKDPLVAAFWNSCLWDFHPFILRMHAIRVCLWVMLLSWIR